jgi:hypothetical protein
MPQPAMPDLHHRLSAPKWLVLALLVALVPAVARADQSTERAKALFQEGTTLFNVGEFDKAIEAWQQGYKEKPDPGFLYNIGQAYRLKGDSQKAIFFYRGYLRNSPKAANKADVEAKITQLQKAQEAKTGAAAPVAPAPVAPAPVAPAPVAPAPVRPAPAPAPPPAPFPAAPTPVGPTSVAPPPVDAPPLAGSQVSASAPAGEVSVVPEAPLPPNHPVDVGVSMGFDAWATGTRPAYNVQPSFALNFTAGVALGNVYDRTSVRLGALVNTTKLEERAGKVRFTSLLAEPSLRVRMVPRRLYLSMGLGIGAVFISGIKSDSALLGDPPAGKALVPPTTITLFELRPAVGLQFHILPRLVGSVTPALSWSPPKDFFYEKIIRFELLFGLSLHA